LIYKTRKNPEITSQENMPNLVASFQESVADVLIEKTVRASLKYGYNKILVSGGVAANSRLREKFEIKAKENNIEIHIPPIPLCMDNAAMVACLGYHEFINGNFSNLDVDVYSRSDI